MRLEVLDNSADLFFFSRATLHLSSLLSPPNQKGGETLLGLLFGHVQVTTGILNLDVVGELIYEYIDNFLPSFVLGEIQSEEPIECTSLQRPLEQLSNELITKTHRFQGVNDEAYMTGWVTSAIELLDIWHLESFRELSFWEQTETLKVHHGGTLCTC